MFFHFSKTHSGLCNCEKGEKGKTDKKEHKKASSISGQRNHFSRKKFKQLLKFKQHLPFAVYHILFSLQFYIIFAPYY